MPDTPERMKVIGTGLATVATSTPDQVMRQVREHQAEHPTVSLDDLTTGVVGILIMEAIKEMVRNLVDRSGRREPGHIDTMRKIRARGLRIDLQLAPLDPGEGEFDDHHAIPFGTADVEVRDDLAIPDAQMCGVRGCALAATHLIHSPAAGLGTWACQCHAAQVEAAIRRKAGR